MHRGATFHLIVGVFAAALSGCAEEQYPAWLWAAQHPEAAAPAPSSFDASAPDAASITAAMEPDASAPTLARGPAFCPQTQAESLPARLVAMSAQAQASSNVVLVSDLFQRFNEVCAPCHTAASDFGQGGFQIVRDSEFASKMLSSVLQHITGSVCPNTTNAADPNDPMPPCASPSGASYSTRSEGDPVKQFAELIIAWIAAGSPPTSFTPPGSFTQAADAGGDAGTASPLVLTPQVGNAMTDIGNCVPSPGMIAIEGQRSVDLDAKFASFEAKDGGTAPERIGLPEHLGDTDLFTLDSATLAQYGVIAYAPGYPLWSDNAGKLRHVRVPRGQSIHYDATTQQFDIPPNTRFYKTFMKQIIDTDNSYRYRKVETRLIVSRPDQDNADGTVKQTALFGSYKWNDDESDAVLIQTPLNDGTPFADTVLSYNVDELLAADVLRGQPADPEEALLEAHATRHYAIPSSQRCIQCHMGSPSRAFVLGFTPLQINRRPTGVGGTFEATGPDEITQLQRFIDAGIVTGIQSPSDAPVLEQPQGSRPPRNPQELKAQGYMLGNCAHCHNPRGFPTVQNPVLKDLLNFLPSATGGIFQFPLERYSPRVGRGPTGTTQIPYITPSLVDLPKMDPVTGGQAADWFVGGIGAGTMVSTSVSFVDYAPWRSLVYRNVDSVFAYTDDYALFPHMPMNTPGYDPRAKQFLGDWMVSIPAIRKNPELVEYAYRTSSDPGQNIASLIVDSTPQPYVEIPPGGPGYDGAYNAAQARLAIFHTGSYSGIPLAQGTAPYSRFADPGQIDDILDPAVAADPICHPIPTGAQVDFSNPLAEHPHWVTTDLTQAPGAWAPRQSNWPNVLVDQMIPPAMGGCAALAGGQGAYADQVLAVGLLQDAKLDDVREFATTPVPFGLWQQQSGCDYSSQKTVQQFTGPARPHWMDVADAPASAPVYSQTPGAAIFKMICINCHGPKADSSGRLAQNLATMTGGHALVADFRDGLFGPLGSTEEGSNRHLIFGQLPSDASPKWTGVADDDRAARYMAWMGLGGTAVNIPLAVLQIVAITKVLDQERTLAATSLSANMLSQAKALCLGLLGPTGGHAANATLDVRQGQGYLNAKETQLNPSLIPSNGDAELWLQLCTAANPSPVHVLAPEPGDGLELKVPAIQNSEFNFGIAAGTLLAAGSYPAGAAVGNERAGTDPSLCTDPTNCATACTTAGQTGCQPRNVWPWCVDDTNASPPQVAWIQANAFPICPDAVKATSHACSGASPPASCLVDVDANRWAVRGAINAGMSVFLYVQSIEDSAPPADFNQCPQTN
jgi:mono/diheme cytochrome c family protein